MLNRFIALAAAGMLFISVGCRARDAEEGPEAEQAPKTTQPTGEEAEPQPEATQPTAPEPGEMGAQAPEDIGAVPITITIVEIEPRLAALCKVDTNKAFFPVDSARLQPEARDRLREIAECARTDALADRKLRIVGHADPRGADEYNKQLGRSRAEAVAEFLTAEGMDKGRLEIVSKGEKAASEKDPRGWPYERRVDIRLAE